MKYSCLGPLADLTDLCPTEYYIINQTVRVASVAKLFQDLAITAV